MDLASLGLEVRAGMGTTPDEERLEIRLKEDDLFVGWFQSNERISNGERIVSVSAQLARRDSLSSQQITAVEEWIVRKTRVAMG